MIHPVLVCSRIVWSAQMMNRCQQSLTACLALLALLCGAARAECPSGEDQCLPGFVWRDAFPGDHVCVAGASRAQAAADNAQAPARTVPGSDLCRAGFVWRDAEPGDKVCTSGTVRAQAAEENRLAGQRRDPACLVPRSATSLGLLALNIAGIGDGGGAATPVRWEARAQRLAASLRRNRLTPDVVTLTEAHAWLFTPPVRSCGRGFAKGAGDYDQIDILLNELRGALGVTYRVAYLTGDVGTFGDVSCSVFWAQAMLYNPARLVHIPPPPHVPSMRHDGRQGLIGTPHLRRSLPLCSRGTRLTPLETLIDGPPQTDKCGRPTPSGPAFTVFGSDSGHVSSSYARFAFASDPSRVIDVFNMHPTAGKEVEELPAILRLIDTQTPPPYAGSAALYPPLLAGDFNLFADGLEQHFPGFARVASAPGDVMAVAIGLADRFPSSLRPRIGQSVVLPDLPPGASCGDPRFLFSDHCGIFVRLDPDGPDAGALRGIFVDGPSQSVSGQPYRLQATASGGSPDLTFEWSPGGQAGPVLNTQAGAPGGVQTWTVTVTDRRTSQSRSTTHTVRHLAPQDGAACLAACTDDQHTCMRNVPLPGSPSVRECRAAFRECQSRCR
jgi:hypothetical protein